MSSICQEEENYVRIILLLTGISQRAVRTFFDQEFAPPCLYVSLKKDQHNLYDLKEKHIINTKQWHLLFPKHPGKCK